MLKALLRFSLFGGAMPLTSPLSDDEWQRLIDEAKQQGVTALTYDAIVQLPKELMPPRRVLFHFASLTKTIEDDNRRREQALLHLAGLDGMPSITLVKGSSLASLYPIPRHRECGDNDIYSGTDTERIASIVEKRGILVDRTDPRHVSFVFEGVTFECHNYMLYHNDDPKWQVTPFSLPDHTVEAPRLLTFTLPYSAFFLAKHTEHHAVFFNNPVRLRSLVDWSLLLSTEDFDFNQLSSLKTDTDIAVFSELMTLYCNHVFGLSLPEAPPAKLEADDFESLYMSYTPRHRMAAVRVARRSWKYLSNWRKYKTIYGQSMFSRFYLQNLKTAIRNHFTL